MIRVVIESPFAGDIEANIKYARDCMKDCLNRGEAPYASHLLYTQDGILDDSIPLERQKGIFAGFTWGDIAHKIAVYTDLGISKGMQSAIDHYGKIPGMIIEFRQLYPITVKDETNEKVQYLSSAFPKFKAPS